MPNWCKNILILKCDDPAQIQRAIKAYNEKRLLSEFLPEPDYQTTPVYPMFPFITGSEAPVDPSEAWWDWRNQNWGTKWDVGNPGEPLGYIHADETGTKVQLEFDSAWAPPVEAMRAFEEAGFTVELYYCEFGVCACGLYTTVGGDQCYDIPETRAEVKATIPDEIDDLFGISRYREKCGIVESYEE